jgi:putative transposase
LSATLHSRKSPRLKGYDYAQPGSYFVTIRSFHGQLFFGEVRNAEIHLSEIGRIADEDWKAIPTHYDDVTLGVHQVMPNHIHGIITINEPRSRDTASRVYRDTASRVPTGPIFGKPIANSLSTIVGSFKSGVTRRIHDAGFAHDLRIWQSRFFDRIIRDDRSHFFIEQYIVLNPLIWEYGRHNPAGKCLTIDQFKGILRSKFGIDGGALALILSSRVISRINIVG